MKRIVVLLIVVYFFSDRYTDAAQATAMEDRLQALLLRFPTADLNHDGKLLTTPGGSLKTFVGEKTVGSR